MQHLEVPVGPDVGQAVAAVVLGAEHVQEKRALLRTKLPVYNSKVMPSVQRGWGPAQLQRQVHRAVDLLVAVLGVEGDGTRLLVVPLLVLLSTVARVIGVIF